MREKHFESNQELIERFIEYLDKCEKKKKTPNLAGFAVESYCCKQTLLNYRKPDHPYFDGMRMIYSYLEDATINNNMTDNFKKFYMVNTFEDYSDATKTESKNINENNNVNSLDADTLKVIERVAKRIESNE